MIDKIEGVEWHPYSQLFPALDNDQWQGFKLSLRTVGQIRPIIVRRLPDGRIQGIEGRNLEKAMLEIGQEPRYEERQISDDQVEEFIEGCNIHRRHLAKETRVQLIHHHRTNGQSIRQIAKAVDVDEKTVRRDLEKIDSIAPSAPGAANAAPELPAAVKGRDGKMYPAKKPKKRKPQAPSDIQEDAGDDANKSIESFARKLMNQAKEWAEKECQQSNPWLRDRMQGFLLKVRDACATIRSAKTDDQCPRCRGEGCHSCRNTGSVSHQLFMQLT